MSKKAKQRGKYVIKTPSKGELRNLITRKEEEIRELRNLQDKVEEQEIETLRSSISALGNLVTYIPKNDPISIRVFNRLLDMIEESPREYLYLLEERNEVDR